MMKHGFGSIGVLVTEARNAPDLADYLHGHSLETFMREALAEAEAAGHAGELPIGAVLVIDGEIVSRGRAGHQAARSQIAHAELNALRAGGERLWRDYDRAVLFTSLEPCPLCLGAAVMADVPHIVFAAADTTVDGRLMVETIPYIHRHIRTYLGGVLEEESRSLIGRYDPAMLAYISQDHHATPGRMP